MTESPKWTGDSSYEVNAETYEQEYPSQTWDYSTKGSWADVVATFAGVFLILSAGMEILHGAAAIQNGDLYAAGHSYLYQFNMTTWGWIHISIGVLSAAAAIGILLRRSWGQISGLVITGLSMIANFAFIPHYPIWSIIVIAFDLLVMWALLAQLGHAK